MKRFVILLVSLITSASLVGCSSVNQAKEKPQLHVKWPFYKISKGNQYMYLLGTIHIGKEEMYPFPEQIKEALKDSQYLVTETDGEGIDRGDYQKSINDKVFLLENGKKLNDYLSKDSQAYLMERAKEYDVDYQSLQDYKLWYVVSQFLNAETADLSIEYGVDHQISQLASNYYVNDKFLETPKEHFEIIQQAYPEKEADQLIKQIPPIKEAKQQLLQLFDDFVQGKIPSHEDTPITEFEKRQNRIIVVDRNKRWMKKFETYLKSDDVYFAAVGAGHLEGKDGLLTYFKENGYVVEKVIK
ncbi:TraB/GumN family protein [Neobacillus mesonae]|uniref:TraB/GumN family protein n=1 Tax=Neobacillus mesonae TaxID=1193713 RepID=UPI002E21271C|nr:TraB/GumN family protein [Neobacillus mesonae]